MIQLTADRSVVSSLKQLINMILCLKHKVDCSLQA